VFVYLTVSMRSRPSARVRAGFGRAVLAGVNRHSIVTGHDGVQGGGPATQRECDLTHLLQNPAAHKRAQLSHAVMQHALSPTKSTESRLA